MPQKTAPPRRRLTKPTHIGPWPRDDYTGFRQLCKHALFLEPRKPDPLDGSLFSYPRKASRFPNVEAAMSAFRRHSVHKWLVKHVPSVIAGNVSFFLLVRRARIVVERIATGPFSSNSPVRTDKRRRSLLNAIDRLQRTLDGGSFRFGNLAQEEMLEQLLGVAKIYLRNHRKRKSHAYPVLWWLACDLEEQTGMADIKVLLDVSKCLDLGCDERTARRYVHGARQTQGSDK